MSRDFFTSLKAKDHRLMYVQQRFNNSNRFEPKTASTARRKRDEALSFFA